MNLNVYYFVMAKQITKKDYEVYQFNKEGATVKDFLDDICKKYGSEFEKVAYSTGTIRGEPFKTPNIYLNKKRIQWKQDFPEGLETKIKDGDTFWFGLIVGGG